MPRPDLALVVTDRAAKGALLKCDLCDTDRQVPTGSTMEEMVETLRLQGWLCKDGVDVCPACRIRL